MFGFLTIKALPWEACISGGGTSRGRAIGRGIPANPAARSPAGTLPLPGEGRLTPLYGTARLRGLRQSELADRKYIAPEREQPYNLAKQPYNFAKQPYNLAKKPYNLISLPSNLISLSRRSRVWSGPPPTRPGPMKLPKAGRSGRSSTTWGRS